MGASDFSVIIFMISWCSRLRAADALRFIFEAKCDDTIEPISDTSDSPRIPPQNQKLTSLRPPPGFSASPPEVEQGSHLPTKGVQKHPSPPREKSCMLRGCFSKPQLGPKWIHGEISEGWGAYKNAP